MLLEHFKDESKTDSKSKPKPAEAETKTPAEAKTKTPAEAETKTKTASTFQLFLITMIFMSIAVLVAGMAVLSITAPRPNRGLSLNLPSIRL